MTDFIIIIILKIFIDICSITNYNNTSSMSTQENARCEWKEFKNLKNSFCGDEKDDVISYVSAIANMEGGHLVIGVKG